MCGIVGTFASGGSRTDWLADACSALRHRGPDDSGIWSDQAAGIAFGHTRLAVIDLTEAGHQPMMSGCGRYHIVYNGEIYNHLELRRALPEQAWRGRSDTETLLACFARWGVAKTLQSLVGMFALALFDAVEQRLILARDRFGEKPLYYGYAGDAFIFGSQLRSVRAAPGFDTTIDRAALALYMTHSYVPTPHSIYRSMRKLPAGSWIELTRSTLAARSLPEPRAYWSALECALAAKRDPLGIDDQDAVLMLERVLSEAVKGQMLSDVPVGAFLSGGIDSSTIVALMQAQSSRPVRTFSIGFEHAEYDESEQAKRVAEHLGTEHTALVVRPQDALALVPTIPRIYDEPFADSSQLPTFLVAQLARRDVTVALSGDGGDELFGGYNRYFLGARAWPRLSRIPWRLRRGLGRGLTALSTSTWDRLAHLIPSRYRVRMVGDKVHKAAEALACRNDRELYQRLVSQWWSQSLVLNAPAIEESASSSPWSAMSDLTDRMMLLDATTYLPDDILVKVDRATMAVSLEARVPMLDHRVFEFAWRLPMHMKLRNGQGKWLLRQLLHRHVPPHLVSRPKMGFAVPLGAWLRGNLRDWAEDLLSESRLRREGYLDTTIVQGRWREHLAGQRSWQYQLWNVLMFEAWLDAQ